MAPPIPGMTGSRSPCEVPRVRRALPPRTARFALLEMLVVVAVLALVLLVQHGPQHSRKLDARALTEDLRDNLINAAAVPQGHRCAFRSDPSARSRDCHDRDTPAAYSP